VGVPKWKRVRMSAHRCFCADHCRRRNTRRRLHGQASSSGANPPTDPDISHAPTGKRSAAQHGTAKECHEPMKTHRECMQGRGGGPAGPVPLPCRASAMSCPMPCPGPPNGRPPSSALRGLRWHGTGPAVAYRVGQWPPRPCMHSRRVPSARVIPWYFRFFPWFCSM
jgi:hypothetical protein